MQADKGAKEGHALGAVPTHQNLRLMPLGDKPRGRLVSGVSTGPGNQ